MQIGTYQLAFLDAIPPYAAVNETVLLAKEAGGRGWDGFVNGVLRAVQSAFTDQFADEPSADALPLSNGRYRRLSRVFFRDPDSDPVGHVAESFSFPRWLIERWQGRFDLAEMCRLGFWFDHPAPLTLRVNPLRANRDDLLANFRSQGVSVAPGSLAEAIRVEGTRRVDSLPGFAEGFFSVQDESAMQAVDLLDPKPGETVWICGGARNETDAPRRADGKSRHHHCDRYSSGSPAADRGELAPSGADDRPAHARLGRRRKHPRPGRLTRILVDVPCSNTGVLGKRPEARWRIDAAEIRELALQQQALLRPRVNASLLKAACSIRPAASNPKRTTRSCGLFSASVPI